MWGQHLIISPDIYPQSGIHGPPGPRTDQSDLVLDFLNFVGPGPWIPALNEDFSKNLTKEVVKLEYLARIKTCLRAWLKNNPSNQVDYSNIFKWDQTHSNGKYTNTYFKCIKFGWSASLIELAGLVNFELVKWSVVLIDQIPVTETVRLFVVAKFLG